MVCFGMIFRVRMNLSTFILCLLLLGQWGWAQQVYLEPPDSAKELFASRPMPRVSLSPDVEHLLIAERYRFRRINKLASRVQALAGIRLNPSNNGPALPEYYFRMELKNEVPSGKPQALRLPGGLKRYSLPIWSPNGQKFAFLQYNRTEVFIHVGDAKTGSIKSFPNLKLNAAAGRAFQWFPDSKGLLCLVIPTGRGDLPAASKGPARTSALTMADFETFSRSAR